MRTRNGARALLAGAALLLGTSGAARGQGVPHSIELLAAQNARLYLHPVTTGAGAALNTSWYRTAHVHPFLHFDVGVAATGALVPKRDDVFHPILPDRITYGGETFQDPYGSGRGPATPTAVGSGAGIVLQPKGDFRQALLTAGQNPGTYALAFPKGYDIPAVPLAVLQARAGLPFGTQVNFRYLPPITVDPDLGAVKSVGVGLEHSITHWFPGFPLDIAVEGALESLHVGQYMDASARNASLIVGRDFSVLSLFVAGEVEHSEATVHYTVHNSNLPDDQLTVSFHDRGDNTARVTAGFSLDFLILKLTAAYSHSSYDVVNAGISFGY